MIRTSIIVFLLNLAPESSAFSQTSFWEQLPGPLGGNTRCLAIGSNGEVYAGLTSVGILRSYDGGSTWQTVLGSDDVFPRAIVVNSKGWVFAGMNSGAFRSTDGGDSWVEINTGLPAFFNIKSFAISRDNGYLYCSGNGSLDGVFRSTNNGDIWELANNGLGGADVVSLVTDSNGVVFAGGLADEFRDGGIYRSEDHGNSWVLLGLLGNVNAIGVDHSNNTLATSTGGLYFSSDGGDTWTLVFPDLNVSAISFNSDNHVFAGTYEGEIFRSTDHGATWMPIGLGLGISDAILCFAPDDINSCLYVGTGFSGAFRSFDNGGTWSQTGFLVTLVRSLSVHGDYIFAGTELPLYKSSDFGLTWSQTNLEVAAYLLEGNGTEYLFAGGGGAGIYRSSDNGENWTFLGLPDVTSIAVTIGGEVFAGTSGGTGGIYRSTNNGDSWTRTSEGLPDGAEVYAIDWDFTENVLVASVFYYGLFRSIDSGETWVQVSGGETSNTLSLEVNEHGVFFAGTTFDGVYRSTDHGESWHSSGLTLFAVGSLHINAIGAIFVSACSVWACTSRVFKSTNIGDTWIDIGGFPPITAFAEDSAGFLYAGTANSAYRTSQSTTSVGMEQGYLPKTSRLSQNYPNPFNAISNFEFGIANLSHVNLKIYDLLGREVATVVDEKLGPGTYTRQWDAAGLASGVYIYRLTVGDFVQARKLALIR